jgi:DNA-binding response OmpR family regulator
LETSDRLAVLVGIASDVIFEQVRPFVSRSTVEVTRVRSGQHALSVGRDSSFDLLLVQHPLPDLEFSEFFATIRAPGSACTGSPLLILTRDNRLESVVEFLDGELAQAVCIDAAPEQFRLALAELIGVATRAKARLGVELSARLDQGSIQQFCQTVNVSEAGMLIRIGRPLPLGTKVQVTLSLPDEDEPIEARGEVLRHTVRGLESVEGVAIRFLEFNADGQLRLANFIDQLEEPRN